MSSNSAVSLPVNDDLTNSSTEKVKILLRFLLPHNYYHGKSIEPTSSQVYSPFIQHSKATYARTSELNRKKQVSSKYIFAFVHFPPRLLQGRRASSSQRTLRRVFACSHCLIVHRRQTSQVWLRWVLKSHITSAFEVVGTKDAKNGVIQMPATTQQSLDKARHQLRRIKWLARKYRFLGQA